MLKRISGACVKIMQKYLPDPFLFAAILTGVVFIMGIGVAKNSPLQMVVHWGNGFWNLLAFSMQMVLVLVTGYTMASSPPIRKLLGGIAGRLPGPGAAIMVVTLVSVVTMWINWGFGTIISVLFAKEVASRVKGVHFPLLVAAGFMGNMVWHGGISGSVPLTIATKGHFMENIMGIIPTSETIFVPFNLVPVIVLLIILPFIARAMHPDKNNVIEVSPKLFVEESAATIERSKMTPSEKMENSSAISILLGVLGLAYVVWYFVTKGFKLNLDIVNITFLFVAILLHGTPRRFLDCLAEGVKTTSGIILQFPFYAGIMGMMVGSGLANIMSQWFVSISTPFTFPLFTFISAAIVNFFVPSGGGQWAVQAPVMIPASIELGVPLAKTAMAIGWGDALTNQIQPFWLLPALGIAGLSAKDVMGYCVVAMLFGGVVMGLSLLLL
ncbi:MAG: short-chain fatty acid transporter [Firmicutes bacterium HGW-Firmicutes-12]|nr:MAG: short-chain fatty acid transporter [Firmicutes bacterium HGW-Firmicutes-12]